MKNRTITRISFMFNVLVVISVLLFLPSGYLSAQGKPEYGGVLRIAERSGPSDVIGIPWEMRGAGVTIIQPALEGLLIMDKEGKRHPLLATSWEVAPDKSSVTFTLRKGVKFHDGSDFNADAAAWNLQKKIDNHDRLTSGWKNAEVIDDYTLRLNLKTYHNYLLDTFTGIGSAMISKASYEKNGEEWMRRNIVGTGPFVFESYQRDVMAKFTRNDHYWQKGRPYLDSVELHYIKDFMTQQAALQTGEIDMLGAENGKIVADLSKKGFEVQSGDTGVIVIIPDSKNPESPFSKRAVREAISLAIDREAIVKARGFGYWEPTQQLPLKGHLAHAPALNRPYDPEKAKRLLKEAGYPNGFETKLVPSPFGVDMNVFVAIQAYLDVIGVKAKIEKVPYSKYSDYRFKGWHNGLLAQPFGVEVNIIRSYDNYFSQPAKMMQFPVLERPESFQELLDKSASTIEPDKGLMNRLGKLIFDEVTVIPVHTTGRSFIHRKSVHDTGHMKWARWTQWNADTAWKSK